MTREELDKQLNELQRDLWEVLRRHSMSSRIPDHAVEEFVIYVSLGIKPTWEI
jgi:hypothetical protein